MARNSSAAQASKERAHWTVEDETVLLNFLILVKSASGDGTNFKKATWKEAALKVNVNRSRGAEKTPDSCRSKYRVLKSTYEVVQAIRGNSGWSWDDEDGAGITPEIQGTWNDYVERHPAAAPFRNAGWAHLAAFDSLGASSSANREANVFRPGSNESGPVDGSFAEVETSADGQDDELVAEEENDSENGDPLMSQTTATPAHATSGCKRSASPHPPIPVKRMREAPGTQVMRGLGTTFDRVADVLEKAFPKSDLPPSPDRKFNAITQCQKIEKDWLDKGQIAKLVVILGKELYASISYQGAMEDEVIHKNVVRTLLGMELEVQEEEN